MPRVLFDHALEQNQQPSSRCKKQGGLDLGHRGKSGREMQGRRLGSECFGGRRNKLERVVMISVALAEDRMTRQISSMPIIEL